jgi:hypothetical protein
MANTTPPPAAGSSRPAVPSAAHGLSAAYGPSAGADLRVPTDFAALREQLLAAAERFAGDAGGMAELLSGLVADVERGTGELLEIFPVCHHSPAAAVHMIRRLRARPPRVVYVELCEDLRPVVEALRDCKLPVALQAFAGRSDAFPAAWAPLSVVAPLTAFSAEYQAIAYCLDNPGTELVFVDRSVDHVFQWTPREREREEGVREDGAGAGTGPGAGASGALEDEDGLACEAASGGEDDADADGSDDDDGGPRPAPVTSHGAAVGVQIGNIEPTFPLFHRYLLRSARVQHFAEWWDRYVEQPLLRSDYATYRQVMCLVGGLFRRLGRRAADVETDRLRERFMWTRMKDHLRANGIDPRDALHVCGAFHAVSDVPEFGTRVLAAAAATASAVPAEGAWAIPPRTDTKWLYGLLPSSHQAIDRQFGMPPGTVTLAESLWAKAQRATGLKPFAVRQVEAEEDGAGAKGKGRKKGGKGSAAATTSSSAKAAASAKGKLPTAVAAHSTGVDDAASTARPGDRDANVTAGDDAMSFAIPSDATGDAGASVFDYLTRPRAYDDADHDQLVGWCVGIVALARRNGYLGSTADAIAVYQTSVLLGQLRNRASPTPYDFRDAAVTCLEKGPTPKKRDVGRLCDVLLGGDRVGRVGRSSLPPLARNVYDRLAPLGVDLQATTVRRALLDISARPELAEASDLLWKLWYLLGDAGVKPIMGQKVLGQKPIQESWELYVGRNQGPLIVLGYEGVTVEQVLEKRLRAEAYAADAKGSSSSAASALAAAEESVLFLTSPRLTQELGGRVVELLARETGAQSAPEVFDRARRLTHYFRSTPGGLPAWLGQLVTTGYAHYSTLLPGALADRGTSPEQVASMLAFVFTLESLALSLGCSRSQLRIAVAQAAGVATDPNKFGLLWTAEWLLGLRPIDAIRAFFDELLGNAMSAEAMPAYLNGHLLALKFTPLAGPLVVELVSKAFAKLPEPLLMPWLPGLIMMLRSYGQDLLPQLMKEVSRAFPRELKELATWKMPWEVSGPDRDAGGAGSSGTVAVKAAGAVTAASATAPDTNSTAEPVERSEEVFAAHSLLSAHRAGTSALCRLLRLDDAWATTDVTASATSGPTSQPAVPPSGDDDPSASAAGSLLKEHRAGLLALLPLLGKSAGRP